MVLKDQTKMTGSKQTNEKLISETFGPTLSEQFSGKSEVVSHRRRLEVSTFKDSLGEEVNATLCQPQTDPWERQRLHTPNVTVAKRDDIDI